MSGTPAVIGAFVCAKCGQRISPAQEPVMADRDGNPFKDYYHEACANELLHQHGAAEGGK